MASCGASQKTIADFEGGLTKPYQRTLAAIVATFEAAGIEFINGNSPGVRLRAAFKKMDSPKNGDKLNLLSPKQTRAARGWLGWSQTELAKRADVSLSTVRDFETGKRTPMVNNVAAMRSAIEAVGIRLLFDEKGAGAGIVRHDLLSMVHLEKGSDPE
jgi:predicted transcriptional regulator